MTPIEKVISVAEAEVGYCEKSKVAVQMNPNVLDEKLAGAGADNMTKYARNLINWVGTPYAQGVAWCDMFVDFCFITAFGIKIAKEMIGGWSAYTPTSAQYYKNMGRWYSSPQVGDQIFFKNDNRICHTGLVYKVDKEKVYTIEGNTSANNGVVANGGAVAKKSYPLSYARIAGYGRPKYELANIKPYLYKGVDVSAAQVNVDYQKLKQAGVDFGIIKIIRKDLQPDKMFETHYSGFISAGISVFGVYNYSYATSVDKARSDAEVVIKTLAGRKLLVCMDVEDKVMKNLGAKLIDIINAYQEVIERAGLPFMLYTGMSFYNTYIKPYENSLKCKDIWMARYYKGYTVMPFNEDPDQAQKPMNGLVGWQYTSSGSVSGYNNSIDLDIIYRDIKMPATVPAKIVTRVATNGSKLNVRQYATNGPIIGKYANGAVVDILDIDYVKGWYKTKDGYISNDYVKSNTTGMITANSLYIRNADSTKGQIMGVYKKNTVVEILRQSSTGWYLTPKGWISNNYTKRC